MVDDTRVLRLLRRVSDDVAILQQEGTADQTRRSDAIWLRGVKYTFVTAIEACVDIAQHVCASQGWGPPDDNGDAMRLLGDHSVLETATSRAMRRAVGFRNVLVHEYVQVDDAIVTDRIENLGDLDAFIRQVTAWLSHRRTS